ncbi:MAG: N-6 DNA methylase [Lachnospiraceae bacterium]|nr:N-6 DNA methylase [Lachnospiraceae bacterium]
MESISGKEYINLKELCETLGISPATGRNWIRLGKLVPEYTENGKPYFSKSAVENLEQEIRSGGKEALKKRRNKAYISGNALYHSYVSEGCGGIAAVQEVLQKLSEKQIEKNDTLLCCILADCAVKLLAQVYWMEVPPEKVSLAAFLEEEIRFETNDCFVEDLITDKTAAQQCIRQYPDLFCTKYGYEEQEDILGLLYISCKSMGKRKAEGAYYTPTTIVRRLIGELFESDAAGEKERCTFLDPCCGTGNFLLQLPDGCCPEQMYGSDIDETSVKLARLNLLLRFKDVKREVLYKNITVRNFLLEEEERNYDVIFGNPPWGYAFEKEEKQSLKQKFFCAKGKAVESYDIFLEQSLRKITPGGTVSFVLPEAVLTVKAHLPIRKLLAERVSVSYLELLGNVFDQVQCPGIILQVRCTGKPMSCAGMKVRNRQQEFVIQEEREITPETFWFYMPDEEYLLLHKISELNGAVYLKNNADFALGIVTGNNADYLSKVKAEGWEEVLKGAEVHRFRVQTPENYIKFLPDAFQQSAPENYYRAPEKLLYRFISSQLVFAYDNRQRLSLNSCNILIPRLEGMNIKYILAVLNSRVAQFYFEKKFHSVKVLRSHLEQIPIPMAEEAEQRCIVELVEQLLLEQTEEASAKLYETLEEQVRCLYGLSRLEYDKIKSEVMKK